MQSIIFEYLDREYTNKISIWNKKYFEKVISEDAIQLIRTLWLEHTEQERDHLKTKNQQELYEILISSLENKEGVIYPN